MAETERARRPSPNELDSAWGKHVPDVIAPGLKVLFVGINPGLWSGAVGHHFAHPSSRFWKALHLAGLTPRLLSATEEDELLRYDLGLTNLVDRATQAAKDLTAGELQAGARALAEKVARFQPNWACFLGVGAYRLAFERPLAQVGLQPEDIAGARIWVLPGPSGQNAHFPLAAAVAEYRRFRLAVEG